MKAKNITGQRFGRLIVIKHSGSTKDGHAKWLCLCDCDNQVTISSGNLKSGNTKSCGCLVVERMTGLNNHNYKGGINFHKSENRYSVQCRDGTQVRFSRIVMEGFLGRELNPEFVVHHRNNDPSKDELDNLSLFANQSDHTTYHHKRRKQYASEVVPMS